MEEVEIKVKIPKQLHDFMKRLIALYKKDEAEFWREELIAACEGIVENIQIPFFCKLPDIQEVNGLKEIFDC